ncbi:DNA-binding response regulator [Photobacterium sanctipauli]|uniref:DNA-binding response regulator n=1 Tax=Photobacterium sanctipauli TaxID=1342794 RepID=A0A2T3NB34_9GAMM|nr:DNA-binding response regulator [Photobacterium sanctipauli]
MEMSVIKRKHVAQPITILVAEPNEEYSQRICERLWQDGYMVKRCCQGIEIDSALRGQAISLVVLSMQLPEMRDWTLLKRCRRTTALPIILLTREDQQAEAMTGFRFGADDYMPAERSVQELSYRIEAILRRTKPIAQPEVFGKSMVFDELEMDRHSMRVSFANQEVTMTPIQFKLLWTLVAQHSEVLPKPYLYRQVLEREYTLYDRSLDMHLSRIRKKLTAAGMPAHRLQTLHGKGYSFA